MGNCGIDKTESSELNAKIVTGKAAKSKSEHNIAARKRFLKPALQPYLRD
jgi:hypothetical protein